MIEIGYIGPAAALTSDEVIVQTIASTTTATGLRVQPSASIHCRCPGARAQALDDRQVAGADCRITAVAGP